jgi:ferredoxin-NADP reductase
MIYADELGQETTLTFTREPPDGWTGRTGRVDSELIGATTGGTAGGTAFVCGSHGFVESAARLLLEHGVPAGRIHTERFGPRADAAIASRAATRAPGRAPART